MKTVLVGDRIAIGAGQPLCLIAGPCVLESEARLRAIAERLVTICGRLGLPLVLKASFDKANRSSLSSYRGPGLPAGLDLLGRVGRDLNVPTTTDIHEPWQAAPVGAVVDLVQVPAFLCRQTDLLLAAAATGKPVNVKKAQFMAAGDMANVVGKLLDGGATGVMLTERGSSFGYHNLVVDMRSLVVLRELGWPVCFDGTHSVQLPSAAGQTSGGERQYVAPLCRAAAAVGLDALFLEVHDAPDQALCDGPNMVPLDELEALLTSVMRIREATV